MLHLYERVDVVIIVVVVGGDNNRDNKLGRLRLVTPYRVRGQQVAGRPAVLEIYDEDGRDDDRRQPSAAVTPRPFDVGGISHGRLYDSIHGLALV